MEMSVPNCIINTQSYFRELAVGILYQSRSILWRMATIVSVRRPGHRIPYVESETLAQFGGRHPITCPIGSASLNSAALSVHDPGGESSATVRF